MTHTKKTTLFIIDDDPVFARLLQMHVREKNTFDVHVFSSGEAGLAHLHLMPKIIILDYQLGGEQALNGKQVWGILKLSPLQPKVIMMSAQKDGSLVLELVNMGIRDYIVKERGALKGLDEALDDYLSRQE